MDYDEIADGRRREIADAKRVYYEAERVLVGCAL